MKDTMASLSNNPNLVDLMRNWAILKPFQLDAEQMKKVLYEKRGQETSPETSEEGQSG